MRRGLARLLRRIKPDLIHSNGFKMHLLGAWTRPSKTPVAVAYPRLREYTATGEPVIALVSSRLHIGDREFQERGEDLRLLLPSLPVVPVYNAVDLERFSPKGPEADLDALAGFAPAKSGTSGLAWWQPSRAGRGIGFSSKHWPY